MSITLCGFAVSNYYNKVKMALLEKGIAFTEQHADTHSHDEAILSASPLGKIPFLRTEDGNMCESQVILEYIEAKYPSPPLMPADPYAAAKVRELIIFIDWHLEIVGRQLYGPFFFGGKPMSEANLARIRKELTDNIAAFKRLAKFSPYIAGDTFTMADCAAFASLPLVSLATKTAFGEDLLLAGGVDHKSYTKFIAERPSAQKVLADRKAAQQAQAATA
jgi:glutathione S-transferase